jgi:hypothetical protein
MPTFSQRKSCWKYQIQVLLGLSAISTTEEEIPWPFFYLHRQEKADPDDVKNILVLRVIKKGAFFMDSGPLLDSVLRSAVFFQKCDQ